VLSHVKWVVSQFEQSGGDAIDSLIGTLGAEQNRNEQRVRITVIQRDGRLGVQLVEPLVYKVYARLLW
jgi:hypothetical protein